MIETFGQGWISDLGLRQMTEIEFFILLDLIPAIPLLCCCFGLLSFNIWNNKKDLLAGHLGFTKFWIITGLLFSGNRMHLCFFAALHLVWSSSLVSQHTGL